MRNLVCPDQLLQSAKVCRRFLTRVPYVSIPYLTHIDALFGINAYAVWSYELPGVEAVAIADSGQGLAFGVQHRHSGADVGYVALH